MSTWRRHRAHRYSRASSIAAPGGEGWTIRNHRAILRSEPYARADLGAASDLTAKSNLSEAAPVSPAPAISPQRHSAVIASAHGDGISGNIGSGAKHVPGGVAGTVQCVLGRPSQITSRPDLHHLSALFGRREHGRIRILPRHEKLTENSRKKLFLILVISGGGVYWPDGISSVSRGPCRLRHAVQSRVLVDAVVRPRQWPE